MALYYEPVFPTLHTLQSDSRLPSSSNTPISQANKDNADSHMDKLKQLYQSLANVPEELCPSSRPSSPSAQIRIERLQQKITNAALKGRYLGDLIHLQCTERSSIAMPLIQWKDKTDTKDVNSFIFPDTEEEWFEWERTQARRRGQDDDDVLRNGLSALKQGRSQSAEEKVKVWKAKLLSSQNDSQESLSSGTAAKRNSQINFPVVKRSTAVGAQKKGKGKPPGIRPSTFYGNAPAKAHELGLGSKSSKSQAQSINSVSSEIVSRGARKQPTEDDVEVQSKNKRDKLPSQSSTAKKSIADLENTTFFLPPTFEPNIITPTPKPQKATSESRNSNDNVEGNSQRQNDLNLEKSQHIDPETLRVSEEISPQAKRPLAAMNIVTPPPSTSRNILLRDKQSTLGDDASRLLTPCSDDYTASHPVSRPSEDHPMKKIRMTPSNSVLVPPSTPKAGEFLSSAADLGNAKGLPINKTPDRNTLPTLNELLATSRRSKPRPRPPPRNSRVNNDDGIMSMQIESRPAKSFISSPASGSTQATPSVMRYIAQSSPVSPLFTQNPSQFAPALTSTQIVANGSPLPRLDRSTGLGIARSASIKSTAASQGLMRASSGLLGMTYNSQFDVDRQIDEVADFLNKDVNFNAWIRDSDASQIDLPNSQMDD